MASDPSDEVLKRFGVRVVAPLGGRLNQHWLVEARRERLRYFAPAEILSERVVWRGFVPPKDYCSATQLRLRRS